MQKSHSEKNEEPHKKDVRSLLFKDFLFSTLATFARASDSTLCLALSTKRNN
jgi:hypothetical protein